MSTTYLKILILYILQVWTISLFNEGSVTKKENVLLDKAGQGYFKELLPYIQKIFPLNNDALKKSSTSVNVRNESILRWKMLSSSLIKKSPYCPLLNGINDEFCD